MLVTELSEDPVRGIEQLRLEEMTEPHLSSQMLPGDHSESLQPGSRRDEHNYLGIWILCISHY